MIIKCYLAMWVLDFVGCFSSYFRREESVNTTQPNRSGFWSRDEAFGADGSCGQKSIASQPSLPLLPSRCCKALSTMGKRQENGERYRCVKAEKSHRMLYLILESYDTALG